MRKMAKRTEDLLDQTIENSTENSKGEKKRGRKKRETTNLELLDAMEPSLTRQKKKVSFGEKVSRRSGWRDFQHDDFNKKIDCVNVPTDRPFSWEKVVKGDDKTIPAFHFQHPYADFMKTLCQHLGKTVLCLRRIHKMQDTDKSVYVFWPVIVHEVKGLYLRVRFFGDSAEDFDESDYWVNLLSKELQPFDRDWEKLLFVAPPHIRKALGLVKLEDQLAYLERNMCSSKKENAELMQTDQSFKQARENMLRCNKYRVGERVELLDNQNPDRVRVAEVQQVRGRRTQFKVSSEYYDVDANKDSKKAGEDRQYETDRTWIDQSSPLIFHVGWAALADYKLEVIDRHPYRDHACQVAQHIKLNQSLNYSSKDATLSKTMSDCRPDPKYKDFKVGMKLEFFDWLEGDMLNYLKVGTIDKILPNDYLLIRSDENKRKREVLPVHASSPYIFPSNYARDHQIPLLDPKTKKQVKNFDWSNYLQITKAKAAPAQLFHETPKNLEEIFPIGSYFEASCHNETDIYFPAKVKALHGRLIEVQYIDYPEGNTELFDYSSSDLFPVGHSEGFGFPLFGTKA